jgi:hypothetical protein
LKKIGFVLFLFAIFATLKFSSEDSGSGSLFLKIGVNNEHKEYSLFVETGCKKSVAQRSLPPERTYDFVKKDSPPIAFVKEPVALVQKISAPLQEKELEEAHEDFLRAENLLAMDEPKRFSFSEEFFKEEHAFDAISLSEIMQERLPLIKAEPEWRVPVALEEFNPAHLAFAEEMQEEFVQIQMREVPLSFVLPEICLDAAISDFHIEEIRIERPILDEEKMVVECVEIPFNHIAFAEEVREDFVELRRVDESRMIALPEVRLDTIAADFSVDEISIQKPNAIEQVSVDLPEVSLAAVAFAEEMREEFIELKRVDESRIVALPEVSLDTIVADFSVEEISVQRPIAVEKVSLELPEVSLTAVAFAEELREEFIELRRIDESRIVALPDVPLDTIVADFSVEEISVQKPVAIEQGAVELPEVSLTAVAFAEDVQEEFVEMKTIAEERAIPLPEITLDSLAAEYSVEPISVERLVVAEPANVALPEISLTAVAFAEDVQEEFVELRTVAEEKAISLPEIALDSVAADFSVEPISIEQLVVVEPANIALPEVSVTAVAFVEDVQEEFIELRTVAEQKVISVPEIVLESVAADFSVEPISIERMAIVEQEELVLPEVSLIAVAFAEDVQEEFIELRVVVEERTISLPEIALDSVAEEFCVKPLYIERPIVVVEQQEIALPEVAYTEMAFTQDVQEEFLLLKRVYEEEKTVVLPEVSCDSVAEEFDVKPLYIERPVVVVEQSDIPLPEVTYNQMAFAQDVQEEFLLLKRVYEEEKAVVLPEIALDSVAEEFCVKPLYIEPPVVALEQPEIALPEVSYGEMAFAQDVQEEFLLLKRVYEEEKAVVLPEISFDSVAIDSPIEQMVARTPVESKNEPVLLPEVCLEGTGVDFETPEALIPPERQMVAEEVFDMPVVNLDEMACGGSFEESYVELKAEFAEKEAIAIREIELEAVAVDEVPVGDGWGLAQLGSAAPPAVDLKAIETFEEQICVAAPEEKIEVQEREEATEIDLIICKHRVRLRGADEEMEGIFAEFESGGYRKEPNTKRELIFAMNRFKKLEGVALRELSRLDEEEKMRRGVEEWRAEPNAVAIDFEEKMPDLPKRKEKKETIVLPEEPELPSAVAAEFEEIEVSKPKEKKGQIILPEEPKVELLTVEIEETAKCHKEPEPQIACCPPENSNFLPKFISVRHTWGDQEKKCIPFATNYTTLEMVFAPVYCLGKVMPMLDLRGHRFDNNTYAANVGLAGRYIPNPDCDCFCEILGFNGYYDYRQGCIGYYNQVGVGIEILTHRWDFRANAYAPFGPRHHIRTTVYDDYEGDWWAKKRSIESISYSFNAEIGCLLWENCHCLSLYGAAGPYFIARSVCEGGVVGAEARLRPQYRDYLAVDLSWRYDQLFETIWQVEIIFNLPLYQIAGRNKYPCCISDRQIYQPIQRFEVMPLSKRTCWQSNF